ncbi:hypothetical protein Tco_1241427 [Tanacetum coccineum]
MKLIPQCQIISYDWKNIIEQASRWPNNYSVMSVIKRISLAVSVYYIWTKRNKRLFANVVKDWETVLKAMINTIRFKLSSVKIKGSAQVNCIEEKWRVELNIQRNKEVIIED